MATKSAVRPFASVLSIWLVAAACAGTSERSESVERVDQLLTQIERVQAETAVARDSAHAALTELCTLVSPAFQGDAAATFAKFLAAQDASVDQAEKLRDSVDPMEDAAADLFQRWTKDMERFGNSKMRQRSQSRLDETRARFQAIVGAAQSAQIALDAFHDDMGDHALFLGNDLNSAAVASLRPDVRALDEQIDGVDARFAATIDAARAYVESAALYGQVETEATPPAAPPAPSETSSSTSAPTTSSTAPTAEKKRTVVTLKPRTTPVTTKAPVAPVEAPPVPTPEVPVTTTPGSH